jgi:hypothetical protein
MVANGDAASAVAKARVEWSWLEPEPGTIIAPLPELSVGEPLVEF